jgi:hypothetical protein
VKGSFRFEPGLASEAPRLRRQVALVLACAGIAVLPLAWRGTSCGHDFDFHLETWMEVVRQWHQGVIYPHWAASANYGAGEPRFVFYPPLSWVLGALLGLILPWMWTPLAFTLIVLLAMGTSFFLMAREWMTGDNAALATCLYILNPYVLFVAYERAAYGELLAAAWMPLLVLFALRAKPSLLPLALVVAGLWLTNAPAAVMGCYALLVLVVVSAILERRWRLPSRAAGATALGLGLAAFYLVPAIYEQRWVEIARAVGSGMRAEDSFLFGHTGEAFHDQVLLTASWIAVGLLLATAVAAILSFRERRHGTVRMALIAVAIVIACLLLPFSDFVWRHTPELKFLQFPWRWLLVLSLVLGVLAGLAMPVKTLSRRDIALRALVMVLLAAFLTGLASKYFWQPCDDEDNVRAQLATFKDGGFEGTDEYTAAAADNGDIQQGLPPIRLLSSPDADEADSSLAENPPWSANPGETPSAQIQIQRWDVEHITASISAAAPKSGTVSGTGFAVLRLMDYPAWRVRVNGRAIEGRLHRDDGLMAIPLPAGSYRLDISYAATTDVRLGRIISLVAALLWIVLAAFRRPFRLS